RRQVERDVDDELEFHLAMQARANEARGLDERAAVLRARREFGGIQQVREDCREAWSIRWVTDLAGDIRYSTRGLRRTPVFSLVAIAVLALGIGANTALFSVVSAVLLRPLPYPDGDRLVRLWSTGQNHPLPRYGSALPDHRAWRSGNRTFEDIAAYAA